MNRRAVCVMISMAAACFHACLGAEMVVGDVAIQDLTPIPWAGMVVEDVAIHDLAPKLQHDMGQVVVVAQAPSDSASRPRDWIDALTFSGNPTYRKQVERQIENERKVPNSAYVTQHGFTYNENGPLGIPSLGFSYGVEGHTEISGRSYSLMPQALALASYALRMP